MTQPTSKTSREDRPRVPVEIVNLRVSVRARTNKRGRNVVGYMDSPRDRRGTPNSARDPCTFRSTASTESTSVYDRYTLPTGFQVFDGPAIVEERESTLVIGPGWRFEVMAGGNIVVGVA